METSIKVAFLFDLIYVVICLLFIIFILRSRIKYNQRIDIYMIMSISMMAAQTVFLAWYYIRLHIHDYPVTEPDFILIFDLNSLEFYQIFPLLIAIFDQLRLGLIAIAINAPNRMKKWVFIAKLSTLIIISLIVGVWLLQ